jgi:hypothetical protein
MTRIVNQEGEIAEPPIMTAGRITSNAPRDPTDTTPLSARTSLIFLHVYAVCTELAALRSAAIRAESSSGSTPLTRIASATMCRVRNGKSF